MSLSGELFDNYYLEAEKYIQNMTIEEKIGQMFIVRYNEKTAQDIILDKKPCGFTLYRVDFDHDENYILNKISTLQNLSMKTVNLPLGIAVDEEGGTVNRVSFYHRNEGKFPSPQEIYNKSGIKGILDIDQEKRNLLRKFKVNINFAPVADISYNSSDYIYNRTLGKSAIETAEYIGKDVEGYVNDNFSCCVKHFPGYSSNKDTHKDKSKDNRSYDILLKEDFKPFEAAIKNKVPMIMCSHNILECKDPIYPVSISKTWHDILRNELNYSGLILTDDLCMGAIKTYSKKETGAALAVKAGNDILLVTDINKHFNEIITAVKSGDINEEIINKACRRVIAWKLKYLMNFEKSGEN